MLKKAIILSIFLGCFGFIYLVQNHEQKPLLSPLGILEPLNSFLHPTHLEAQKVVYGFLPYWTLKDANIHYPLVTHLAYFGIDFSANGQIVTKDADGNKEPGLLKLKSERASQVFRQSKSSGNKTILVLRAMTQDVIESIVNNSVYRQTAIQQSLSAATNGNFDGLNIDFEYVGTPSPETKRNFSIFIQEISTACKIQIPNCVISVDVFADSAIKNRIWDYPSINPYVNHVIVMAYDFFRPSSTQAGPVAPLRGACASTNTSGCLNYDISQSIADLSRILLASKIVLGVPFYGYQWQTASEDHLSNAYPNTGQLATYKRVNELINQNQSLFPFQKNSKVLGLQTIWSDTTLTPRLVFRDEDNNIQQIYYEDNRSLSLKYDLVNQSGLGGIAIWALGYEGDSQNLWQLIQAKFFSSR